ncbi:complement C1q subcomponent subunit C-like [Takifugu rubripes]|uniref:complement C1q subcomponent subunit C-like n=1 Tax=Takifugu rubripes TaxID=31033 RepID=UPI001145E625|nr:complement C1q subcomponent subunit C-like [Takifugu rubripes]
MTHPCCLLAAALSLCFSQATSIESCPAGGIPGLPGFPGSPGRDGRDGVKGEKGQPGVLLDDALAPLKGAKGEPGMAGISGKRGQSGDPGQAGGRGLPGLPGEPGDSGTVGAQQRAAFSVARGTNQYPDRSSVIRFTKVITNINNDYNTETGRFRCRVPGTYFFVFHASLDKRLCVQMNLGQNVLSLFCDHRQTRKQVTSGGLTVHLSKDEEVWLESKTYVGMRGDPAGYSIFSGFLLHPN